MPVLLGVRRSVDEMFDLAQQLLSLIEDLPNVIGNSPVVLGLVVLILHVQDQRKGSDVDLFLLMPSVRVVLQGERKAKISKLSEFSKNQSRVIETSLRLRPESLAFD